MKALENKEIKVFASKRKMILLLLGSLLFVIGGVFIIYTSYNVNNNADHTKAFILGGASILFFGLGVVISLIKLFSSKPALIISSRGITDNTTVTNVGFIPWRDIVRFESIKIVSNNFIVIYVNNPQAYISNAKNVVTRKSLKYNYNTYGSPIAINASVLSLRINKVEQLLSATQKKYS